MASKQYYFQLADYLVFSATLVISLGIGVYYAFSGGRQKTTQEYLMAGRQMSFLPVALSLFVTFKSSILMLGYPAEGYAYGMQMFVALVPHLIANLLCVWIMVPLLYPLKLTSMYEYLELRFRSRAVRLFASCIGIMYDLFYMGIVLYGPATALQAVTGFPLGVSIIGLAAVSLVYTSMGGLKAVIWTDVFQTLIMTVGIFAVLIKGTLDAGGAKAVWDTAEKGGRLQFFNFDLDPTVRHTFWNLCLSGFVRGFDGAFRQSAIQRMGSVKTQRDATKVLLMEGPSSFVICILTLYQGTVAYAYYSRKQCDPLASHQISNPNQIMPLFVMEIFDSPFGLAGLFVASLFSASLSTLSSCQSSISALVWTDMVKPLAGSMSEGKATLVAKVIVVVSGLMACCIAWLISLIGGTLQQVAGALLTAFFGPQLGIFFLGCYSPRANAKGTIIGGVIAFALTLWIALGMSFSPGLKRTPFLPPTSMDNCYLESALNNGTTVWGTNISTSTWVTTIASQSLETFNASVANAITTNSISTMDTESVGINKLYSISYTLISSIGVLGTVVFGYIFSLLTGANKPGDVDPRYLIPMSDSFFICLPKCIRRAISQTGTQFMKPEFNRHLSQTKMVTDESVTKHPNDTSALILEGLCDDQRSNRIVTPRSRIV